MLGTLGAPFFRHSLSGCARSPAGEDMNPEFRSWSRSRISKSFWTNSWKSRWNWTPVENLGWKILLEQVGTDVFWKIHDNSIEHFGVKVGLLKRLIFWGDGFGQNDGLNYVKSFFFWVAVVMLAVWRLDLSVGPALPVASLDAGRGRSQRSGNWQVFQLQGDWYCTICVMDVDCFYSVYFYVDAFQGGSISLWKDVWTCLDKRSFSQGVVHWAPSLWSGVMVWSSSFATAKQLVICKIQMGSIFGKIECGWFTIWKMVPSFEIVMVEGTVGLSSMSFGKRHSFGGSRLDHRFRKCGRSLPGPVRWLWCFSIFNNTIRYDNTSTCHFSKNFLKGL